MKEEPVLEDNGKNNDGQINENTDGKSTIERAYKKVGKTVRGLLCMLTFFVLMVFAGLIFFMVNEYSVNSITDRGYSFYESNYFRNQLRDEAAELLNDVLEYDKFKGPYTFSIIDVGKSVINHYNYEDIDVDGIEEEGLNDDLDLLKDYIITSEKITGNFYNYEYAASIIDEMDDNSYLHFSKESFNKIFTVNGVVNKNHIFSSKFSERAYFIYLDPVVMQLLKNAEDTANEKEESAVNIAVSLNSDSIIYLQEQIYENTGIRLSDMQYAVYDPEDELLYSTWDDYFNEYDNYIYDVSEVASYIKDRELNGEGVSSIIFPLLWSENHQDILELAGESYMNPEQFEKRLQEKSGSSFYYYVKLGDEVYANVNSAADVTDCKVSYMVGSADAGMPKPQCNLNDLFQHEDLIENLNSYYPGGIMYFGLDNNDIQIEDLSPTARLSWGYEKIVKYKALLILLVVIAFALLMWQAAGLIKTTGRVSREDKDTLVLNRFDRLYTELWFIIYIGLNMFSIQLTVVLGIVTDDIITGLVSTPFSKLYMILIVSMYSLSFGYTFMQLTLSFARRIKAKNFKKRLYVRVLYANVKRWVKEKKSADKLKIITIAYIGVQIFVLVLLEILLLSNVVNGRFVFIVLCIFMPAVWIGLAWFVKGIIEDIGTIKNGINSITEGNFEEKVSIKRRRSLFRDIAEGVNQISDGLKNAVDTSLKDERMKTELITNVSHDLKTPLTSIINYINLLKGEKMPTPEAKHYVEVLDSKAHRLSQLTEDLLEAAKATSGNIELDMMPISFEELMKQALGEFEDKFAEKNLLIVSEYPEHELFSENTDQTEKSNNTMVLADGRRLFRVLDNILQNAYKYAMENTRIYIDLTSGDGQVRFVMKNISKAQLNISADELMERFTRGDSSRTTEGSGLGLSIAKDLTKLMGGSFELEIDGDMFKVILTFPEYESLE